MTARPGICYEKQVKTAHRLLALLALLTLACQSTVAGLPPDSRVLLETPGVRVRADARERGREWTIRGIEAEVLSGDGILKLSVTVFDDRDGDGQFAGREKVGNWFVESPAASQHMSVYGHLTWRAAPSRDALERLIVETIVSFSDGSTARGTERVFE